ncbi:hypothetical protein HanIR_Chr04g0200461 [Helianthus annuus]|nr:hypothetical protein HanIR_Chr04g0200461 [Helianthus annuus]
MQSEARAMSEDFKWVLGSDTVLGRYSSDLGSFCGTISPATLFPSSTLHSEPVTTKQTAVHSARDFIVGLRVATISTSPFSGSRLLISLFWLCADYIGRPDVAQWSAGLGNFNIRLADLPPKLFDLNPDPEPPDRYKPSISAPVRVPSSQLWVVHGQCWPPKDSTSEISV